MLISQYFELTGVPLFDPIEAPSLLETAQN